jgi:hypothetical protein
MLKLHKDIRFAQETEQVERCKQLLFSKLINLPRETIERGFLAYVELTETSPFMMRINACYGANCFLSKVSDHNMNFWKAHISSISNQSLIGMIIGDISSSGYDDHQIGIVCNETLTLFRPNEK